MGNCLFDSLNFYLKLASSHELRQTLCRFVLDNRHLFEESAVFNGFSSVDAYVEHMRRDGIDGDHMMLSAAALHFHVRIVVEMPGGGMFTESPAPTTNVPGNGGGDERSAVRTLRLCWVPGHYSVTTAL